MNNMRTNLWSVVALVALLWVAIGSQAYANENGKQKAVQPPEAVSAAFQKAYPKAVIRDISTETKDGKTYYEIESMDGKQRRDLLYAADGTVFEVEEAIAISDLPKTITTAVAVGYPKGKLQKAERIIRGDVTRYEVLLENGENNLEVLLDSSGKIQSHAKVADEDEETDSDESIDED